MSSVTSLTAASVKTEFAANSEDSILHNEALKHVEGSFTPSNFKAAIQLSMTLLLILIGVLFVVNIPWYLLPICWIFLGFCACRLVSVAYGCSTNQFFNVKTLPEWLNQLVGLVCMLPLLYPFENVKYLKTYPQESSQPHFMFGAMLKLAKSPLWFFTSIWECIVTNIYFDTKGNTFNKITNSIVLILFASFFTYFMVWFGGFWTLFKYYLAPLMAFHLINSIMMKMNEANKKKGEEFTGVVSLPLIIEFLTSYSLNNYKIAFKWYGHFYKTIEVKDQLLCKLSAAVPQTKWRESVKVLEEKFGKQLELIGGRKSDSITWLDFVSFNGNQHEYDYSDIVDYLDLRNIDYIISIYLIGSIIVSIYGIFTCPFNWKTYLLSFVSMYSSGIGISTGYHRFFAHLSCKANLPVRLAFLLIGSAAFQGSAISWSSDHRRHHKFIDTERDPYNIKNSFFHAHMGWLMKNRPVDHSNIPDLTSDPYCVFQHKYYPYLAIFFGYVCPTFVAGYFWGDWKGGFLIAGVLSKTILQHCTFFINSLAHSWGDATFNDDHTARDSYFVSLLTFGEGYHNFHHTFAYDYRNGVRWYHFDPGKWIIYSLSLFGWTYELKRCDDQHYEKGRILMRQKVIDTKREEIDSELKELELLKLNRDK
ncbi:predicted protein [Naegleria gruberi]|uniref:Predicted protein n=1 Tax=Naegleria gruberi TaxID=5762 RepID=D2V8V7_NAEGR|nr:uncharacterized protein NAEGRDRAFT_31973 [Naegleria gruberi]EFC46867.1 predicted protein [Naegleria gruberi]|eukprot:XP_002679611.1 predicted protein [Naegleria gruberi strain NEG-M]